MELALFFIEKRAHDRAKEYAINHIIFVVYTRQPQLLTNECGRNFDSYCKKLFDWEWNFFWYFGKVVVDLAMVYICMVLFYLLNNSESGNKSHVVSNFSVFFKRRNRGNNNEKLLVKKRNKRRQWVMEKLILIWQL